MGNKRFEEGLRIRREVLGAEFVDQAFRQASDFSRPLQEFVTEFCWGGPWSRGGISRQVRSLINLAMLTALNRSHELGLHVQGALRNGCTPEQIREVLLQATVYAGVPAGMEAFRVAEAVINGYSTANNGEAS